MKDLDRRIAALAIPALGSLAIEPLYVLVDTAIVGRLGTVPLGGLALASTVLNTSFFVFNFLAYGTTPRVAFRYGRGDRRGAASVAAQALWVAIGIGALVAVIVAFGGPPIARALGGRGEVLEAASTYLRISAAGAPFVLIALVGNGYLRGVHDTRTPWWILLAANVANVGLEVWFVYGMHWGVAGSAWGTVVVQVFAGLAFAYLIARDVKRHGAGMRPNAAELRGFATTGRQLVVRTGALLAALGVSTSVAARLGTATLGAHQIVLQVETFLALAVDALAIAAQAMVGAHLGAGRPDAAREVSRRLLRLGVMAGVVLCVGVVGSSRVVPAIFSTDARVLHLAAVGLAIVGVLQLPASAVFVLDGVLMGASDTAFLQWGMLAALVAFAPFAWLVLHYRAGIAGLWGALFAWMLARLLVNGLRFRGDAWTSSPFRTGGGTPAPSIAPPAA